MIQESLGNVSLKWNAGTKSVLTNFNGRCHGIPMKQCEPHTVLVQASRQAYTAGASLLRPIVRKNNEMSWKQSSNTLSTVVEWISRNSMLPVNIAPAAFTFYKNSQTSILL